MHKSTLTSTCMHRLAAITHEHAPCAQQHTNNHTHACIASIQSQSPCTLCIRAHKQPQACMALLQSQSPCALCTTTHKQAHACIASQQSHMSMRLVHENTQTTTSMHGLQRMAVRIGLNLPRKQEYNIHLQVFLHTVLCLYEHKELGNYKNKMSAYQALRPLMKLLHHKRKAVKCWLTKVGTWCFKQ